MPTYERMALVEPGTSEPHMLYMPEFSAGECQEHASRPIILVVDDDTSIAQLLIDLLESAGYRAYHASNGHNALAIARTLHPELVLTDYLMPDLDGQQVIRELRTCPTTRDIPAVLMSSTRPREATLQNVPFLPKPFDLDDVLTVVGDYVAEPVAVSRGN